jgi:hypothetical protein
LGGRRENIDGNYIRIMEIKHLKHHEINFQKWDACIQNACNSLVYAESWFLDIVSPNWEALILGDYDYVMPLPVKKKYGISFLAQPPLTQQLGIFSKNNIEENVVEVFITKLPYKSFHLNLNEQNLYNQGAKQSNYLLLLNKDYSALFSAYSTNTKRNIKKTCNDNIEIKADLSANEFLEFYHATEKNYPVAPDAKVNQLIQESFEKKRISIYGAYNANNQLVSALCLLHSAKRLIYLLPVSNMEGKNTLSMFKIVDKIIENYANNDFLLDFEGSRIESIAHFYQGFGAELNDYYEVKRWSVNDFIKRFFRIFAAPKKNQKNIIITLI